MWFAVNLWCAIYYFAGIVPIVWYGWHDRWLAFWVYVVYWLINLELLDYAKSKW